MRIRIGAVSFLNTVPLIYGLESGVGPVESLELDMPSRLADRLRTGEMDVALVPVAEVFRGCCAAIVPGTGIATRGEVETVKLFCNGPLNQVDEIRCDRASRTSVALLQVLMTEWGLDVPYMVEWAPSHGSWPRPGQADLVIGDMCFAYGGGRSDSPRGDFFAIDLGRAWLDLTGLPFVFAVWGVSANFQSRSDSAARDLLKETLSAARDLGVSRIDELARAAAARGRRGHNGDATPEAVAYYLRKSLIFSLGEDEMSGLELFRQLCGKHGIVSAGPPPRIL